MKHVFSENGWWETVQYVFIYENDNNENPSGGDTIKEEWIESFEVALEKHKVCKLVSLNKEK